MKRDCIIKQSYLSERGLMRLIKEKIRNNKDGEYYGGYAVGGHKGNVHPAQVIGLYNGVLVYQHPNENQHRQKCPRIHHY